MEDLRSFLLWTWGRQRSFYIPTNFQEVGITIALGSNPTMVGYLHDLATRSALEDGIAHLDILRTNGTRHQVAVESISGYIPATGLAEINLDRAPGFNNTEIANTSLLYHVRLASDTITLDYDGRDSVLCSFRVVTVKQ